MENINSPEKKSRPFFTKHENVIRFLIILSLGILGYALALFDKIPGMDYYGVIPIEGSDVVVLATYALYGFWAALFVAIFKVGLVMLTFFTSITRPIPLEYIFTLLMSFFLLFGMLLMDRSLRMFHKNIWIRLLGYVFVSVFVSVSMISLEYAFLIPIAFNDYQWTTIYMVDVNHLLQEYSSFFSVHDSYDLSVLRIFMPYNLVRSMSVCLLYEIFFHHLIFRFFKYGLFAEHYFLNRYDLKDDKLSVNLRKSAIRLAKIKELTELRIEHLKKKNSRKTKLEEGNKTPTFLSQYDYRFDMTIDDYGSIHEVSILTDSESSVVIVDYMKNSHPGAKFHISSYQEGQTIVRNASTDGLGKEIFREVNGYDEEVTIVIKMTIVIQKQSTRKAAC